MPGYLVAAVGAANSVHIPSGLVRDMCSGGAAIFHLDLSGTCVPGARRFSIPGCRITSIARLVDVSLQAWQDPVAQRRHISALGKRPSRLQGFPSENEASMT